MNVFVCKIKWTQSVPNHPDHTCLFINSHFHWTKICTRRLNPNRRSFELANLVFLQLMKKLKALTNDDFDRVMSRSLDLNENSYCELNAGVPQQEYQFGRSELFSDSRSNDWAAIGGSGYNRCLCAVWEFYGYTV